MKLFRPSSKSVTESQPYYGWKVLWSNGRDHIVLITQWIKKKRRQLQRLVLSGGLIVAMLAPTANFEMGDAPASLQDRSAMQQALATNKEITATWFMRKECWRDLEKRNHIKTSLIEAGLPR